ncbi:MAG: sulfite exporter TauE/SafE family protein [Blastocatellia bacterium]|nr:sulfite exporter TauE/SafE family protein [Blastocatellia bacterium]
MEELLSPSPEQSAVAVLFIGFLFGLYHAIEADHLAAVSAIVSEHKNPILASIIGGFWGLGHTISLFIVGALVVFVKVQISEQTEGILEGIVGLMLVLLGLNAIRKIFSADEIHSHSHEHDGVEHSHIHAHTKVENGSSHHRFAPRSVAVGMIHGLAGSAGLMLLVLPTINSPWLALFYILIFGIGSIAGMVIMSLLMGLPLYATADRFAVLNKAIRFAAGGFSLIWGAMLFHEKIIAA